MAAPLLLRGRLCFQLVKISCRTCSSTTKPPHLPLRQRIFHYLCTRFYDIENLINWSVSVRHWHLRKQNVYYSYTQQLYGEYIAAAYYILNHKGGIRFAGHRDWFRANRRGKFDWSFLNYKDVPLEAVDASGSLINYDGLDHLVCLKELKHLNLSGCPHVDDWCLDRLHMFKDSLEELNLAGCPQVTERGLAVLHHLKSVPTKYH
uniref:Distal membrane-arm assembly complex protein 2 n=1 Tax=Latimeria chalumnae TaxID=7897 RepID=H3BFY2_LATCH